MALARTGCAIDHDRDKRRSTACDREHEEPGQVVQGSAPREGMHHGVGAARWPFRRRWTSHADATCDSGGAHIRHSLRLIKHSELRRKRIGVTAIPDRHVVSIQADDDECASSLQEATDVCQETFNEKKIVFLYRDAPSLVRDGQSRFLS